jgi:hypothetical protein
MAKCTREQCANEGTQLPSWIVEHMIKLSEYAERSGFSAFEAALIDATEALLNEQRERGLANRNRPGPAAKLVSNVVPFLRV